MECEPKGLCFLVRVLIAKTALSVAKRSLQISEWCISPYERPVDYEEMAKIYEEMAAEYRHEARRDKLAKVIRAQNEPAIERQLDEKDANEGRDSFKKSGSPAGSAKNASEDIVWESENHYGWQWKFTLRKNRFKKKDSD